MHSDGLNDFSKVIKQGAELPRLRGRDLSHDSVERTQRRDDFG